MQDHLGQGAGAQGKDQRQGEQKWQTWACVAFLRKYFYYLVPTDFGGKHKGKL